MSHAWAVVVFDDSAHQPCQIDQLCRTGRLHHLIDPSEARLIGFAERRHLLPESYLYGLTDVATLSHEGRPAFLLGRLYPQGRWFYLPAAFVIKSTLGFLLLLWSYSSRPRNPRRREILFLVIPPLIFFAVAMASRLDIGLRHILPPYSQFADIRPKTVLQGEILVFDGV